MYRPSPIVRCALLLVVACAIKNQGNSSRENKQNDTLQHENHVNFITTRNQDGNSTRDDEDSVQHKFYPKYVKNLDMVSNQDAPSELRSNFTKIDDGGNFTTSHAFRLRTNSNEENFNKCNGAVCIPICCQLGYRMILDTCISYDGNYTFPEVDEIGKKINEVFPLVVSNPCNFGGYLLEPTLYPGDEYIILVNGSIYRPQMDRIIDPTNYCFSVMYKSSYELFMCYADEPHITVMPIGFIVSLPFLLMILVVYTVLPELLNMHGYTLRGYVASLFVAYSVLLCPHLISSQSISHELCIGFAFVTYFSFMASFFWLNVMCFDIWWTFRDFQSLQRNVKQRDKKKFILYSIYALGCTALFTIICAIMDFVPSIPETFIKPEFGVIRCWFKSIKAKNLYFYGPMCVIIICNICLFICTALNIARQEKETVHQLRDLESKCHNDNKQRFHVYLKLFILMVVRDGVFWSMQIVSWRIHNTAIIAWYITDVTNTLHSFIIFYMFVWKDKIKKSLLKRFSCKECAIFSRK